MNKLVCTHVQEFEWVTYDSSCDHTFFLLAQVLTNTEEEV